MLAQFVAARAEDAFTALVGRCAALVWANCRRVLGATPDAEDAFQAVFLALARSASSIRGDTLARWLSRRVALNARTAQLCRLRHESRVVPAEPAPAPLPDGDVGLVREELGNLPERLREPLVLYYLHGKTRAEVGLALGVSDRAVAQRLTLGLATLRTRLARRGFAVTVGALGPLPRGSVPGWSFC